MENDAPIVLYFDGLCNLCSRWVQFVRAHDRKKKILLRPLQSDEGIAVSKHVNSVDICDIPGSMIFYYQGKYYTKSDAVLKLVLVIGGIWKLLYAGIIIPRIIRNSLYDFVARNRYRWFGKVSECKV